MAISNESSVLMQARWDWSDNSVSGKWGTAYQVYRKNRAFVPADDAANGELQDGQPVVVTRNKVRGRGRALHIKFNTEPGKDAHILGWSINFDVLTDG